MAKGKHLPKGVVERTFLLPRELADQLREASYKHGRSESVLVREAIERYLSSDAGAGCSDDSPA